MRESLRSLRLPLFVAVVVFVLHGCAGSPAGPEARLQDLIEARQRWEDRGPASYGFTYELNCFCGGPGNPPARITVGDGRVTRVFLPSEDREVPDAERHRFPTVDDLFADVEGWLRRDPVSARAEFDADFGHPVDVFVDFRANTIDEELGFLVRDLTPLERREGG